MKFLPGLLLVLVFLSVYQINAQEFEKALQSANSAQNPNVSISALRQVESAIDQVADSLKVQFYLSMGIAYGQLGKRDTSLYYLDQVEYLAIDDQDNVLINIWNAKGLVYMGSGEFGESLAYYQKALKLAESKTDVESRKLAIKIIGNAAGVFYQIGDLTSAIDYMKRAISLSESIGLTNGLGVSNLRMAIIYKDLDSLDQSISRLQLANEMLTDTGDTIMLLYSKNTLGGIYEKQSNHIAALNEYIDAENLAIAISNTEDIVHTQASIANLYLNIHRYDKAKQKALQILERASESQLTDRISQAHDILYKVHLAKGNTIQALKHRNQYINIKDSISNVEVKSRIAELEATYETERKEAEIEQLTLENSLYEANLARNRTVLVAIVIGGGLAILLMAVFFILRNKKLRAEQEAQSLQFEALQKRLFEIQSGNSSMSVSIDMEELNAKLHNDLTEREFQILRLSLGSKTNTEISEELFISVSTVKFHLRNMYAKLGVSNRKEAFEYVVKKA